MEMVQFHPTGLLAGEDTRMTGTVLEEGLRGAGGWLTDRTGERFMLAYDPKGERATRDIVSRSIIDRVAQGLCEPHGGVFIEMGHLGPENVRRQFKGMVERCADCGFDLAGGPRRGDPDRALHDGRRRLLRRLQQPTMPRLFAAGEDTGGVHGANRLGGNGVANSTVFGGIAGDAMASFVGKHTGALPEPDKAVLAAALERAFAGSAARAAISKACAIALLSTMWEDAGILRTRERLRARASDARGARARHRRHGDGLGGPAFNLTFMDRLNLENLDPRRAARSSPRRSRARTAAARISARIFRKPPSFRPRVTRSRDGRARRSRPRWRPSISRACGRAKPCCARRRSRRRPLTSPAILRVFS